MRNEDMNEETRSENASEEMKPETATEAARRELADARENHATAYFAAQTVPSDPEEALLRADALRTATQAGKTAFRGYVQAVTNPLAAQIDGVEPNELRKNQNT